MDINLPSIFISQLIFLEVEFLHLNKVFYYWPLTFETVLKDKLVCVMQHFKTGFEQIIILLIEMSILASVLNKEYRADINFSIFMRSNENC